MEHGVEALKIAFAVIVLTIALSVSMFAFDRAKSASDIILGSADKFKYSDIEVYNTSNNTGNRIVGMETVVPTLYKYYKERYKVVFLKGTYDSTTGKVNNVTNLEIYKHEEESISSFDISEEIARNESWTRDVNSMKNNLDLIISGKDPYEGNPLSNMNSKFIELNHEEEDENVEENEGSTEDNIKGNKTTTKRIITYILLN